MTAEWEKPGRVMATSVSNHRILVSVLQTRFPHLSPLTLRTPCDLEPQHEEWRRDSGQQGALQGFQGGKIEVFELDKSVQAPIKVALGVSEDGDRMQGCICEGGPEAMGSCGKDPGINSPSAAWT